MDKSKNLFLNKKRKIEESINPNYLNINKKIMNTEKDIIILNEHSHWINKILILKKQQKHNLISSSTDGLIILYDEYPKYNPVLKMKLFGDSGVVNLTELNDGTIIACSFASIKQLNILYDRNNNIFNYKVINYFVICSTYVFKCLELINEDLLCITQQNNIIFLRKYKENSISTNEKYHYKDKEIIELLKNELCINILQLTNYLFISCNIANSKYDLTEEIISKKNINCIKFYDQNFNFIRKIQNIYPTKSQNSLVKINEKYVIVGVEICSNEINWNNQKGVALINYQYLELLSFYETDNQISSIALYNNVLYFGDDKGILRKYELDGQEIFLKKIKQLHQYNISSIEYDFIYDKNLKKNIFILLSGSNDQTIKILSDLN